MRNEGPSSRAHQPPARTPPKRLSQTQWARREAAACQPAGRHTATAAFFQQSCQASRMICGSRNQRLMHFCVFVGAPPLCHCEDIHRSSGKTGKPASDSAGAQTPLWPLCPTWHPDYRGRLPPWRLPVWCPNRHGKKSLPGPAPPHPVSGCPSPSTLCSFQTPKPSAPKFLLNGGLAKTATVLDTLWVKEGKKKKKSQLKRFRINYLATSNSLTLSDNDRIYIIWIKWSILHINTVYQE